MYIVILPRATAKWNGLYKSRQSLIPPSLKPLQSFTFYSPSSLLPPCILGDSPNRREIRYIPTNKHKRPSVNHIASPSSFPRISSQKKKNSTFKTVPESLSLSLAPIAMASRECSASSVERAAAALARFALCVYLASA